MQSLPSAGTRIHNSFNRETIIFTMSMTRRMWCSST